MFLLLCFFFKAIQHKETFQVFCCPLFICVCLISSLFIHSFLSFFTSLFLWLLLRLSSLFSILPWSSLYPDSPSLLSSMLSVILEGVDGLCRFPIFLTSFFYFVFKLIVILIQEKPQSVNSAESMHLPISVLYAFGLEIFHSLVSWKTFFNIFIGSFLPKSSYLYII